MNNPPVTDIWEVKTELKGDDFSYISAIWLSQLPKDIKKFKVYGSPNLIYRRRFVSFRGAKELRRKWLLNKHET